MTSTLQVPSNYPLAPPSAATPRALRHYQIEAADAVWEAFGRRVPGPAVVLPTG